MKTKILATVALTTLLGTGLYAACYQQGQGMMQKGQGMNPQCPKMMQKNQNGMTPGQGFNKNMQKGNGSCQMMKKGSNKMAKKGQRGVLGIFKKLNLTAEQKTKIIEIKREIMAKKRTGVEVAFTKDSFDKAKFIESMKQKRDYMLESRAEMIEKTYALLTSQQKEQFKVLLDLQQERRNSMMQNMQYMRKGMNF